MHRTIGIIATVALIVGAGSFYGGMRYQITKTPTRGAGAFGNFAQQAGAQRGGRANGTGGGINAGEIIAEDEKSMTIKLRDGGSKILFFSDTTQIMKSDKGSKSDLVIGTQITATGTANPDGSINAESIQIRPASMSSASK